MRISKVKHKLGKITVCAEQKSLDGESVRMVRVECTEEPRPELHQALNELLRQGLLLIDAPKSWEIGARLSGVSINEEEGDGRMGAVATLLIDIPRTNSPLVVNTPHLREELDGDPPGKYMPKLFQIAVEKVAEEGQLYLNGERAQASLLEMPPAVPAAETGAALH